MRQTACWEGSERLITGGTQVSPLPCVLVRGVALRSQREDDMRVKGGVMGHLEPEGHHQSQVVYFLEDLGNFIPTYHSHHCTQCYI